MEKREFIRSKVKVENLFEKLPPFDKVLLKTPMIGEGTISMRKSDWQILSLVDGKKNIYQILAESPLTILETLHSIQWLINTGLLFEKEKTIQLMKEKVEEVNGLISSIKDKINWKVVFEESIHEFTLENVLREAIVVRDEGLDINEDKLFLNTRVIADFFIEFYDKLFQKMESEFSPEELNEIIKIIKG